MNVRNFFNKNEFYNDILNIYNKFEYPTKIKNIKNGNSYINHSSNNDINKILKKKFLPTYDFSEINNFINIVIRTVIYI